MATKAKPDAKPAEGDSEDPRRDAGAMAPPREMPPENRVEQDTPRGKHPDDLADEEEARHGKPPRSREPNFGRGAREPSRMTHSEAASAALVEGPAAEAPAEKPPVVTRKKAAAQ